MSLKRYRLGADGFMHECNAGEYVEFAELATLTAERIALMRAYDPNCDEYVHADELQKMRAAREIVEAVQELAELQGSDPEGCLIDAIEEAKELHAAWEDGEPVQDDDEESLTAELADVRAMLLTAGYFSVGEVEVSKVADLWFLHWTEPTRDGGLNERSSEEFSDLDSAVRRAREINAALAPEGK